MSNWMIARGESFDSLRTSALRCAAVIAVAVASTSCGDVVRQGRSPVFLVIDTLGAARGSAPSTFTATLASDVVTNLTQPPPCTATAPCPTTFNDLGQAVLSLAMKNVSVEPTTNNQVTIRRYRVDYTRSDGRNVAGRDVPYGFDGASTVTIAAGATATVGFEIVRNAAKQEAPLVQLINGANLIDTIATVTFYGTDQVGNAVSVSGTIRVTFGNFADTTS
jgi:hypothetical protein